MHPLSHVNLPPRLDDFYDRRVEVELGDEAVRNAEESLGILLGLLLQLDHSVHVSDGVHCRDKNSTTYSHLQSFSLENRR